MVLNEEGSVVRNVHMCTSQGSSLISINVRLAARVLVVKPESSTGDALKCFQPLRERVGRNR